MTKSLQLKPQDVLILLKLLKSTSPRRRLLDLAHELALSQSEVSQALERLRIAQLVSDDKKEPLRRNAFEFLIHAVKYAFPARLGPVQRGIPTAHAAPPLSEKIICDDQGKYVWPTSEGNVRGHSVLPLYPSVPHAAGKDSELYELLALVDALRVGRAREQKLAAEELEKRILNPRLENA